jgi:hypothetical protein|tara:strand:+ start:3771 stop:3893 length:123 start_codon:yes stop_codon:yes gene_type:complete
MSRVISDIALAIAFIFDAVTDHDPMLFQSRYIEASSTIRV